MGIDDSMTKRYFIVAAAVASWTIGPLKFVYQVRNLVAVGAVDAVDAVAVAVGAVETGTVVVFVVVVVVVLAVAIVVV